MEMYIAIADFMAIEKSSISLRAGQCVQVRSVLLVAISGVAPDIMRLELFFAGVR